MQPEDGFASGSQGESLRGSPPPGALPRLRGRGEQQKATLPTLFRVSALVSGVLFLPVKSETKRR
jgi:hypothetical protein